MAYYFLCKWISNIQFVYVVIPAVFLKGTFKMKNCLWSRNWKQSVQQFKGAELMKVSVNYYLRRTVLVSLVCWCLCWLGHPMELRWEKGVYPHERKDIISRSRQKFQNTEGAKAATDVSGRWALTSENCWLISVKSRFWVMQCLVLILRAMTAPLVVSFRQGGEACGL